MQEARNKKVLNKITVCVSDKLNNVNIVDLLSPPYDSEFDGGSGF